MFHTFHLLVSVMSALVLAAVAAPALLPRQAWTTVAAVVGADADADREAARRRDLDDQRRHLQRRIEVRDPLLDDLIAGRVTFAEAVTRVAAVLREDARAWDWYPGKTAEEKAARNLVTHLTRRLENHPARERLEREFAAYFAPAPGKPVTD